MAKVTRDRMMAEYAKTYPMYDFDSNMGYGSKLILRQLRNMVFAQFTERVLQVILYEK